MSQEASDFIKEIMPYLRQLRMGRRTGDLSWVWEAQASIMTIFNLRRPTNPVYLRRWHYMQRRLERVMADGGDYPTALEFWAIFADETKVIDPCATCGEPQATFQCRDYPNKRWCDLHCYFQWL